jgi:hypothetical protein
MPSAAVAPIPCTARESLVKQLRAGIDELLFLLDEVRLATAQGDFDMADVVWHEFGRAYPNRRLIFERLQSHVAEHGCGFEYSLERH